MKVFMPDPPQRLFFFPASSLSVGNQSENSTSFSRRIDRDFFFMLAANLWQFFPVSTLEHPENKSITSKAARSTTPPYPWLPSGVPVGHFEEGVVVRPQR
jgi:hypothetical protein